MTTARHASMHSTVRTLKDIFVHDIAADLTEIDTVESPPLHMRARLVMVIQGLFEHLQVARHEIRVAFSVVGSSAVKARTGVALVI